MTSTTLIRLPERSEIPALVEMGRRFHAASGYSDIATFDANSVSSMLASMIDGENFVFLVVEKKGELLGGAGALIFPCYLNLAHRTAQELFWYVDPEHRGVGIRLFDALCSEVKRKGAESLMMITLESLKPELVGAFYERRGFRNISRSFIKGL
jgi:GNAT superfamily N-acetyltransferase